MLLNFFIFRLPSDKHPPAATAAVPTQIIRAHKAILRMIRMVVENAHKCGKWAGICGELGADLELTDAFMEMGVDELSVAPSMVLKVRKNIREYTAN